MRINTSFNSINTMPQIAKAQKRNAMTLPQQTQVLSSTQAQPSVSFKGLPQVVEQMPATAARAKVYFAQLPGIRRLFNSSTKNLIKISQTPAATADKLKSALVSAVEINRYRNVELLGNRIKELTQTLNPLDEAAKADVPTTYLQFMLRRKDMQKHLKTILDDKQSNAPALKRLASMFTGKKYNVDDFLKTMGDCQKEYQQKLKDAGIEGLDQLVKSTGVDQLAKIVIAPNLGDSQLGHHIVARINKKTVGIFNLVPEDHIQKAGGSTPDGKGVFTAFSLNQKLEPLKLKLGAPQQEIKKVGVKIMENLVHGITPNTREHLAPLKAMNAQDEALLNVDKMIEHVITEWKGNPVAVNASHYGDYKKQLALEEEKASRPGFLEKLFTPKQKQEPSSPVDDQVVNQALNYIK
ncbi:MAG: hypothetical protein PHC34_08840 [Candidatus Gastranaerophilales bacterium]|nr:hypothetical protein [Candidatus Gastranaerophilales bacterium]